MEDTKFGNRLAKVIIVFWIVLVVGLPLVCMIPRYYNEDWIIGKNKEQIERRYGEFSRTFDFVVDEDRGDVLQQADYGCGYFSKERYNIRYYYIVFFNCEGVAIGTERNWSSPGA